MSRGLGDVYKRQKLRSFAAPAMFRCCCTICPAETIRCGWVFLRCWNRFRSFLVACSCRETSRFCAARQWKPWQASPDGIKELGWNGKKKQNGRSSVWDSGSVTTRLPLLEVPFCLKKDFFRNCSPCRRAWAEVFCFGNIPRMFTPFTLRIGMNWPTPTRPKHWRNWKHWPGRSFELYTALSSFGSSTFSRIATNAAGTMPDSPQISCRAWGALARMPLLAPMP